MDVQDMLGMSSRLELEIDPDFGSLLEALASDPQPAGAAAKAAAAAAGTAATPAPDSPVSNTDVLISTATAAAADGGSAAAAADDSSDAPVAAAGVASAAAAAAATISTHSKLEALPSLQAAWLQGLIPDEASPGSAAAAAAAFAAAFGDAEAVLTGSDSPTGGADADDAGGGGGNSSKVFMHASSAAAAGTDGGCGGIAGVAAAAGTTTTTSSRSDSPASGGTQLPLPAPYGSHTQQQTHFYYQQQDMQHMQLLQDSPFSAHSAGSALLAASSNTAGFNSSSQALFQGFGVEGGRSQSMPVMSANSSAAAAAAAGAGADNWGVGHPDAAAGTAGMMALRAASASEAAAAPGAGFRFTDLLHQHNDVALPLPLSTAAGGGIINSSDTVDTTLPAPQHGTAQHSMQLVNSVNREGVDFSRRSSLSTSTAAGFNSGAAPPQGFTFSPPQGFAHKGSATVAGFSNHPLISPGSHTASAAAASDGVEMVGGFVSPYSHHAAAVAAAAAAADVFAGGGVNTQAQPLLLPSYTDAGFNQAAFNPMQGGMLFNEAHHQHHFHSSSHHHHHHYAACHSTEQHAAGGDGGVAMGGDDMMPQHNTARQLFAGHFAGADHSIALSHHQHQQQQHYHLLLQQQQQLLLLKHQREQQQLLALHHHHQQQQQQQSPLPLWDFDAAEEAKAIAPADPSGAAVIEVSQGATAVAGVAVAVAGVGVGARSIKASSSSRSAGASATAAAAAAAAAVFVSGGGGGSGSTAPKLLPVLPCGRHEIHPQALYVHPRLAPFFEGLDLVEAMVPKTVKRSVGRPSRADSLLNYEGREFARELKAQRAEVQGVGQGGGGSGKGSGGSSSKQQRRCGCGRLLRHVRGGGSGSHRQARGGGSGVSAAAGSSKRQAAVGRAERAAKRQRFTDGGAAPAATATHSTAADVNMHDTVVDTGAGAATADCLMTHVDFSAAAAAAAAAAGSHTYNAGIGGGGPSLESPAPLLSIHNSVAQHKHSPAAYDTVALWPPAAAAAAAATQAVGPAGGGGSSSAATAATGRSTPGLLAAELLGVVPASAAEAAGQFRDDKTFQALVKTGFFPTGTYSFKVGPIDNVSATVLPNGYIADCASRQQFPSPSRFSLAVLQQHNAARKSSNGWLDIKLGGVELGRWRDAFITKRARPVIPDDCILQQP